MVFPHESLLLSADGTITDPNGFKLPAGQARKAKQLAARKATEVANANFFAKGGTHKLLNLTRNQVRHEATTKGGSQNPQAKTTSG